MNLRHVTTIFKKDLRDAIRDARVLVALVIPLGIGLFYSFIFDDEEVQLAATLLISQEAPSALPDALIAAVDPSLDLTVNQAASAAEVRAGVAADEAEVGLVIPAGFDAALAAGSTPVLTVVLDENPSVGADFILASLEPVLRDQAGQAPPATIDIQIQELDRSNLSTAERLGLRTYTTFLSYIFMAAIVGIVAVPIVLAEETEKKTYDALALVATDAEIIAAKALLGCFYVAVMSILLLAITRLYPDDWGMFAVAIALLAVCLIGLGLLVAGVLKNATQLNTWSGVILLPIVLPAFLVDQGLPATIDTIAALLPTGAAARLIFESATAESLVTDQWRSVLVLVIWTVIAFSLLLWTLRRRRV